MKRKALCARRSSLSSVRCERATPSRLDSFAYEMLSDVNLKGSSRCKSITCSCVISLLDASKYVNLGPTTRSSACTELWSAYNTSKHGNLQTTERSEIQFLRQSNNDNFTKPRHSNGNFEMRFPTTTNRSNCLNCPIPSGNSAILLNEISKSFNSLSSEISVGNE